MWITGAVSYNGDRLKVYLSSHYPSFSCSYFDDEEVDINEWSTSWLHNLLSKEMRFENVVRLWGNDNIVVREELVELIH